MAAAWERPATRPPRMVASERLVPGIKAKHWHSPTVSAERQPIAATSSAVSAAFFGRQMFGDEDDQSADDQSGRDDFDREKIGRDDVLEQEAEQGGREERDQDRGGEGDGLAVAAAKTRQ